MSPDAARIKKLLYVSDAATNDVFVYNYVSGKEVGKITGLDEPRAQCVGGNGDVYIATATGIGIFSHDGRLRRFGQYGPTTGCASTFNRFGYTYQYKSGTDLICIVAFRKNLTQCSRHPPCYAMWPGGFDYNGHYVVEGATDGVISICSNKRRLSYNGTIYAPGSVMWDGKYLALTDQAVNGSSQTGIYQATLSGWKLTSQGETVLSDPCDSGFTNVIQPFIVGARNTPKNTMQGTVVVGGNAFCPGTFDYWKYPAGGFPFMTLPSAPQEPVGQSVSIAPEPPR